MWMRRLYRPPEPVSDTSSQRRGALCDPGTDDRAPTSATHRRRGAARGACPFPGVGPAAAAGGSCAWRAARRSAWSPSPAVFLRAGRGRGGQPLPLPPRRRRGVPGPGLALPARRPARPVAGRRPGAVRLDRRGLARGGAARAGPLRDARRHLHAGGHLGGGRARSCRSWRDLGVTVLEVMPVAEFPGRFGWGYDGVDLFAPTRLYGTPDDFRRFVDRGPRRSASASSSTSSTTTSARTATTSTQFADDYFTDRYETEWGEAINFDGAGRRAGARVLRRQRRLLDRRVPPRRPAPRRHAGDLRRLAPSTSWPTIGRARARGGARAATIYRRRRERAAGRAAGARRPSRAATASTRCGTTTSTTRAMVALTGRSEAYYTDYRGTPAGVHLGGQVRATSTRGSGTRWQKKRRGTPALGPAAGRVRHLPPEPRPGGQLGARAARCHQLTSPGRYRAMTALLLLAPGDADAVPGAGVRRVDARSSTSPTTSRSWPRWCAKGRREFLAQFPQPRRPEVQAATARPGTTRRRSSAASSTWPSATRHAEAVRAAPRPAAAAARGPGRSARQRPRGVDGAVLGPRGVRAALLRRTTATTGCCSSTSAATCTCDPAPEPLLAPPEGSALGSCSGRARTRATAAAARRAPDDRGRRLARFPGAARRCRAGARREPDATSLRSRPMTGLVRRACAGRAGRAAGRRVAARRASGWSPTAWAATPRARSAGVADAPLPRPADRRAAGAARPRDDAQPPVGAGAAARRRGRHARRRGARRGGARRARRRATCSEFRLEAGLPVWRYEVGGYVLEKRRPAAAPAEHRPRHATGWSAATGRCGCKLRPSVHFRAHDAPVSDAARAAVRADRASTTATRSSARRRPAAAAAAACTASDAGVHRSSAERIAGRALPGRGEPRLRGAAASCGARATSASTCARTRPATLVASTEPWETIRRPAARRTPARRARAARAGWSAAPPGRPRRARPAELVLAADQFIITPAGRVEDAARARAAGDEVRTVIAGYHWFTDWGRDTMISLEGLTLATGRHAEAGYILRTFAHYVRDGLIPNLLPRGRRTRASTTPPTPRSGSSTPSTATWTRPATATTLRLLLPTLRGHRRAPPARHALRHRRRSGRRPAAPGRGGLSAHLDGRQGRRLGGDAAARQGGRDQRPLVQRPAPAGAAGCARTGRRRRPPSCAALRRAGARSRSTGASGTSRGRLPLRRRRRRAGRRPGAAGPNQVFAISLPHPVLDPRPLGAGARRRSASGC